MNAPHTPNPTPSVTWSLSHSPRHRGRRAGRLVALLGLLGVATGVAGVSGVLAPGSTPLSNAALAAPAPTSAPIATPIPTPIATADATPAPAAPSADLPTQAPVATPKPMVPQSTKVIVVTLAAQSLTAYDGGTVVLTTPVTTGRPTLPTPPGTYHVLRRNSPWRMVSSWPKGTAGYYAPTMVEHVLWFREDGYGIHDAPWRSTYGPGTNANGSHGCVNVPGDVMTQLYRWADTGTTVIVR